MLSPEKSNRKLTWPGAEIKGKGVELAKSIGYLRRTTEKNSTSTAFSEKEENRIVIGQDIDPMNTGAANESRSRKTKGGEEIWGTENPAPPGASPKHSESQGNCREALLPLFWNEQGNNSRSHEHDTC